MAPAVDPGKKTRVNKEPVPLSLRYETDRQQPVRHLGGFRNGFTRVDLSQSPLIPFQIIYRNTLISQFFPFTAKDVPAGHVVPPQVMGEYYPCGRYINPIEVCCNLSSPNAMEDLLEKNLTAESTLPDE